MYWYLYRPDPCLHSLLLLATLIVLYSTAYYVLFVKPYVSIVVLLLLAPMVHRYRPYVSHCLMLLVCLLATSCVVMPPAIPCILLAIMFVAMPLFSVFVVVLFATTCVAMPPAIPRSTLSDLVCCNASCSWYSLVVLLATTCVAMSPAILRSTFSDHLCCNASCYLS